MKIITEDVYKILGQISIFFSTLDILTTSLIFYLTTEEYKKNNKPLNDRMTLAQKFIFLKGLSDKDVKDIDVLNRVRDFLDEAIIISQERNRFIHDQWEFKKDNMNNGTIKLYKITGLKEWKWKTVGVEYDLQKLNNLLTEIGRIQGKIGREHKLLEQIK